MSNIPNSIAKFLEVTKGGKGSGRKPGHGFGGNQWVKYDENGNPLPSERASRSKTPSSQGGREESAPALDPKIQKAVEVSSTISKFLGVPADHVDRFNQNMTKILTDPESYRQNLEKQAKVGTADTENAAILGMIGCTALPKVVPTSEFDKMTSPCYFSGLTTRSGSQPLSAKMSNLMYGDTPRYGGPAWGAAFYSSSKLGSAPHDYATNSSEGGIFRYRFDSPDNVYVAGSKGMAKMTMLGDETVGGKSEADSLGLKQMLVDNGYTQNEANAIGIALWGDSSKSASTTPAIAGYDGLYEPSRDYMMALNRGGLIFPDQYAYWTNARPTLRETSSSITPSGVTPTRDIKVATVPTDQTFDTTKSALPVEKGESAGHAFRGNQYTVGEGGGSSYSSRYRYARSIAKMLYTRSSKAETGDGKFGGITGAIQSAAAQTGGTPIKPEFRLKTVQSLTRKILLDSKDVFDTPRGAIEEASTGIGDALRYTISYPDDKWAKGVQDTLESMRSEGFELVPGKDKNYFNENPDSSYRGMNCVFKDSVTNQLFELQFHTPSSLAMIDEVHPLYEATLTKDPNSEEYTQGQAQMRSMWATVPIPPFANTVGTPAVKKSFDF